MMRRRPVSALLFLLALLTGASRACADVSKERTALYSDYSAKLAELADWCRQRDLGDAVKQLQAWLPKREEDTLTLFVLAPEPAHADDPPPEWRTRWQALRDSQAASLVTLAQAALREHHPSLAFQLVNEALRENPEHQQARRFLGYSRHLDAWHTLFEIRQLRAHKVWHDKFGWLPQSHVDRYENGERYYQGDWMSAAKEALLRADLKRGWHVETDHYSVTTNHSLEEGVRLARRLEQLYAIWQQVFISFVEDEPRIARRFELLPRGDSKRHSVVYHRSRGEYNDALRSAQPKIDITLGIYFDQTRKAHFFAGADQEPGTLFHEGTHQLFQETRQVAPDAGRADNFWFVEGIACYMETLTQHDGYWRLGGANAGRMPAARHRLLEDNFYVPLAELASLGMRDLQSDPRIARLYSQSAGLADFLMHAQDGRHREAAVHYLLAIYRGRATSETLPELVGASYETLDRQYREFMSPKTATTAAQSKAD